ncbi:TPA: flavin reductase family protein, partial [bacterium]|nr:flavin reductase family protein [bacterium]
MKKEVAEANATKLIYNGPCVLVTCQRNGRPNVFTVSWNTPVSIVPPIVAISCVKSNYSWEIIRGTKEFTINVPEMDIVDAVFGCGKVSGR